MRYPYERLLTYLVSRRADVDAALDRYGLPAVGLRWAADCEEEVRRDAPFALTHYLDSGEKYLVMSSGILEWAAEHGLRELWESQPEFGQVMDPRLELGLRVFMHPYARAILGLLILSEVTTPGIIEVAKERLGLEIDGDDIDYYRDTFWNPGVMSRSQWEDFAEDLQSKEERHYISWALTAPSLEEIRYALDLKVVADPETIVRDIMVKARFKFNATMENANATDPKLWSDVALRAYRELSSAKKGAPSEAEQAMPTDITNMFAVQLEQANHVPLTELQGALSVSAGPKKTAGGS